MPIKKSQQITKSNNFLLDLLSPFVAFLVVPLTKDSFGKYNFIAILILSIPIAIFLAFLLFSYQKSVDYKLARQWPRVLFAGWYVIWIPILIFLSRSQAAPSLVGSQQSSEVSTKNVAPASPNLADQANTNSDASAQQNSNSNKDNVAAKVTPNIESHAIVAGNFKFRLIKCSANDTQLNIAIEVESNDEDDHFLYVSTKRRGGIPSMSMLKATGMCSIIASDGTSSTASAVEFAEQAGNETGQSTFKVFAKTHPTMNLIFENVSRKVNSVRLDLAVCEVTGANFRQLPVRFDNLKIDGRDGQ